MKKLILSLAMVMTMILVSTAESKAIISVTFVSGKGNCGNCGLWDQIQSCLGPGVGCTWKIGVLANPTNIILDKPISTNCSFDIVNDITLSNAPVGFILNLTEGKSIYNKELKCYINLMPGKYNLVKDKIFLVTILYSKTPKFN